MAVSPTVMDFGDGSYSLGEEIELLEAIYIHELTLEGPRERPMAVSVLLHPSTGEEEDKRFVCLTLFIYLPQKYPSELPSIHIKTPRGLSEAHIESILENLRELSENCLGRPMLYELIEYAKESLTDNNTPSCACAICLCHFQDDCEFTKTECYHYFHCRCLARYMEFSLQQDKETDADVKVECPMCRLPITYDLAELKTVASSAENEEELIYKPSAEIQELQKKMSSLLEKQKRKGGLIDLEQERNKFLIDITSVRQEETGPERPAGHEADTITKSPIVNHMANHVPKRLDAEQEASQADHVMRKDKPDRNEKKEFSKYSGSSRGPRRPIDKTRHRSGGERIKHYEQRRTDKERPTTCDRLESVEKEGKEKESAKEPDKQGSDFALWAETKPDGDRTEPESERKTSVADTSGKDLRRDPGKDLRRDPRKNPGKDSRKDPWKDPRKDVGKDHAKNPGVDPGKGPRKDPGKAPGKNTGKEAGKNPAKNSGEDPGKDPRKDLGEDSGKDPGKNEIGFTGRDNNNKSSQNTYGERSRSARRGRGRSGRGKPSAGSANESRDGARTMNKNSTSSGDVVKRSEVTGPLENRKPSSEESGRLQAQNNLGQEIPSREYERLIKKDKVFKPPPGFENFQADKVGRGQTTNNHRPPPGFKQHATRPRPPPGLGNLVEGPGQNTSQSVTS